MRSSVHKQKGQNFVEYVVLVCAVVVFMIAALSKSGPFAGAVKDMLAVPTNMIDVRNQEIKLQQK